MKIGVAGKGGVGKTTVAAIIARSFADANRRVIALDCDTNPNLGIALGLGVQQTDRLAAIRESLDDEESDHAPTVPELLQRFGAGGPAGIHPAVVSKIEQPNPG
ncbi:MAG: AAA family ATPase [Candidatus Eremiobacteraeota bacterium]|nr:AAA family ATPase [Candidatus Eremiobacteraeota bacterium]